MNQEMKLFSKEDIKKRLSKLLRRNQEPITETGLELLLFLWLFLCILSEFHMIVQGTIRKKDGKKEKKKCKEFGRTYYKLVFQCSSISLDVVRHSLTLKKSLPMVYLFGENAPELSFLSLLLFHFS